MGARGSGSFAPPTTSPNLGGYQNINSSFGNYWTQFKPLASTSHKRQGISSFKPFSSIHVTKLLHLLHQMKTKTPPLFISPLLAHALLFVWPKYFFDFVASNLSFSSRVRVKEEYGVKVMKILISPHIVDLLIWRWKINYEVKS